MKKRIVCIGSVLIDELYFTLSSAIKGTSNPSVREKSVGGVMSNISRHLSKLGFHVDFVTALGNDQDAQFIQSVMASEKVSLEQAIYSDHSTGVYSSIMDHDGDLIIAAVVDHAHEIITPEALTSRNALLKNADYILADTNISIDALQWIIAFAREHDIKLIIEPVSVPKAQKLKGLDLSGVYMMTPNEEELMAMAEKPNASEGEAFNHLFKKGLSMLWLRKGKNGSELFTHDNNKWTLPAIEIKVKDSTGAGDSALAGWLKYHTETKSILDCMKAGHAMAYEVLQQKGTVIDDLCSESFFQIISKYYPDVK